MSRILLGAVAVLVLLLLFFGQSEEIDLEKKIPAETMASFFNGMQTRSDGIAYRVVRAGTGRSPQLTDRVQVHYRGFFRDGRVFDSSYRLKEPAIMQVNQVITGWTRMLQEMKEGEIREVFIPADLAYGSMGAGRIIPPDTDLCFQIEYIKIYSR
ncbi:MAG: FKBP-type peptidyl-prolyl cis-trans isomerase [Candidatus Rifleibacteriota bacterium]